MNNAKKVVFRLVLAGLVVFVTALVADRVLGRLKLAQPRGDAEYVQRFVRLKEHQPNLDREVSMTDAMLAETDGFTRGRFRFRTDANGFLEPSAVHASADARIVFFGGSTTECGHMAETSRFPFVVGRLLDRTTGRAINTFNAGVSGNNTLHSLDSLINKVLPMNPQIVVLMENINDLNTLLYLGGYWNDSATRSPVLTVDRRPSMRQLVGTPLRSLFPHIHAALGNAVSSRTDTGDEFASARGTKITPDKNRVTAEFSKQLLSFVGICRAHGITPVLMTQASRITTTPDPYVQRVFADKILADFGIAWADYTAAYAAMNEVIRKVARTEGIALVDLETAIPHDRKYLYDPVHYTEAGSLLAAETIAPVLARELERSAHSLK